MHKITRKLFVMVLMLLAICSFSLSAYADIAYISGELRATKEHRAYILTVDGESHSLTKVPLIEGAEFYEVSDMKNGGVLFRVADKERDIFRDTRFLDLDRLVYRSIALDDYKGQIKILDNGYYARKTPMGAFEIFEPNTLNQLSLQFDYGPKLDNDKIWSNYDKDTLREYDSLFDKRVDYHKYFGLQLIYSPYSKMYIMLYALTPANPSLINDWIRGLSIALFDESGRLIKTIPLPANYIFDTQGIDYDSPTPGIMGIWNGSFGWQCNLSVALSGEKPSQILLSGVHDNVNLPLYVNTILIDLESETTTIPSQQYVKDNFQAVRMVKRDYDNNLVEAKDGSDDASLYSLASPVVIENKNTCTNILSAKNRSVLYTLSKDYIVASEKADLNGKYYVLLKYKFPWTEEDGNPPR